MKEIMKKICLLGDGAVGKTSLIRKYVYDVFDDKYIMTIGTKVTKKVLTIDDIKLTLLIYDVLGQKRFARIHSSYYRGASGAIIVCDVTRAETVDNMALWAQSLFKVVSNVPVIFIGNKIDLSVAPEEKIKHIADQYNAKYFFTSAKTGENVENIFYELGLMLCSKFMEEPK